MTAPAAEALSPSTGWRDGYIYRALAAAGRSALGWEVLRRDAAYRALVRDVRRSGARGQGARVFHPMSAGAARRFGLLFRRSP